MKYYHSQQLSAQCINMYTSTILHIYIIYNFNLLKYPTSELYKRDIS